MSAIGTVLGILSVYTVLAVIASAITVAISDITFWNAFGACFLFLIIVGIVEAWTALK